MGSISTRERTGVNSVCIIGAGPSGLAAAKYLLAERTFSNIVVLEQRSRVGGLWNYVPCTSQRCPVPQTDPHAGLDEPLRRDVDEEDASSLAGYADLAFMSPIYDQLETNIPRGLMGFSDLDWPVDCQLFPKHETVLEYIERYAEGVKHLIQFQTQVVDIRLDDDERWVVKTQAMTPAQSEQRRKQTFDAVLVANGHFNVPSIPSVPGIEAWNMAYPGSITHSKFYRAPDHYAGKKTIVVGNSASGVDIGAQIATVCKLPLLQSQKSESYLQPDASSTIVPKPEIVEYIVQNRSIRFKDGSIESGIDAIVYCTGYFYSFPFLNSLDPPVVTTGERVENTYKHIFYRPHPTLAFAVLNQKIIPFPMAEAQSAVIAGVWSGRLDLPSEWEMEEWEKRTLQDAGEEKNFHLLKFPKDADYINEMHDWAMSADDRSGSHSPLDQAGLMNGDAIPEVNGNGILAGKEPPYWGEKEYWTRERFPAIKKAFQSFGEERHTKRTLESVGFDFQAWKRNEMETAHGGHSSH